MTQGADYYLMDECEDQEKFLDHFVTSTVVETQQQQQTQQLGIDTNEDHHVIQKQERHLHDKNYERTSQSSMEGMMVTNSRSPSSANTTTTYSAAYCSGSARRLSGLPIGINHLIRDSSSISPQRRLLARRSFASTKAPSQTLKWLMDNFEGAEGLSLPRATLFALYMQHCSENHVQPMNAASFGKMIRSIFSGLKTRRLGTRGNSKYHYYGIKLKQHSNLQKRLEDVSHQINPPLASLMLRPQEKRQRCTSQRHLMAIKNLKSSARSEQNIVDSCLPLSHSSVSDRISHTRNSPSSIKNPMQNPELPLIDTNQFQIIDKSLQSEDFEEFRNLYVEHFEASVASINSGQFEYISSIWNAFWRHPSFDVNNSSFRVIQDRLSTEKFLKLCQEPSVIDFVYQSDNLFYDKYSDYIFPSIINTFDDFTLINLRNGSTLLPNILNKSIVHLPDAIKITKNQAKDNFLSYIKDIVSISQSSGAVKNIFRSKTCLNQIMKDFDLLDFEQINNRLFDLFPLHFENFQLFRETLETFFSQKFENICNDSIVDDLLMSLNSLIEINLNKNQSSNDFVKILREFYCQWCLYSSMILRELTLQSASSFGIFQVLRTLLDDFLMHNIKLAIAKLNDSPILSALRDVSNLEQNLS